MTRALGILLAAALLVWPAVLNLYPLVFIDTVSYLRHTTLGEHPWDKTAAYGPFLYAFHWGSTLWLPLAAQGLLLSVLLWLVQRVVTGGVTPLRHLMLCAMLAALTTAPWFNATMMPDIFAASGVLCLFLLGFGEARLSRAEMFFAGVLGAIAIAVHLSHLPTACGLVVLVALLRRHWLPVLRVAAPVVAAVLFLLTANMIAFGRPTLSAHGSVFLLARLQADGPVVDTLRDRCPAASWYLCDFIDAMPMEAGHFLWSPDSPPQRDRHGNPIAMGGARLAPEAREIIAATIRDRPFAVARAMALNTLRQLVTTELGDTLYNVDLQNSVEYGIRDQFGPRELSRFRAGQQMRGHLPALATPFISILELALVPALALVILWLGSAAHWRDGERLGLVLFVLAGILGNAFATGGLSGVHDRYAARIIWLLPLAAALAWAPRAGQRAQAPPRFGVGRNTPARRPGILAT